MAVIAGLKGTGDFATGERPEDWHEGLLYLWPHGKAPLLSLLSKAKKEKASDWHIHWFEADLAATREIAAADVDSYDTDNDTVTFASVKPVKVGTVLKQAYQTSNTDAVTIILSSKITDKKYGYTLVDGSEGDLSTSKPLTVIGTAYNEGANLPEGFTIQPDAKETYCQIFRHPVKISRTASKTTLRTGKALANEKKNALHYIGMDIENSMFHGKGSSSEPRMMKSIFELLAGESLVTYAPSSLADFWAVLEKVFAYGSAEKIAFAGAQAIGKLVTLVEGKIATPAPVEVYGVKLTRWETPWGTLYLKPHPLFTANTEWTQDMAIIDMAHVTYKYIDDITYKDYKDAAGYDAIIGEYIAECAIVLDSLKAHHYICNFT